ncbi:MAG: hypothetical protein J7J32_03970 [Candidatus Atribacteria bacterium]|nr:hypothetical protein [Candidatus Atribacteria bacterium]MCD6349664.1 hypothetical protein [Candidatus Atribacteria bacterium]
MRNKKEIVTLITPFSLTAKQKEIIIQKFSRFAGSNYLKAREKIDPSLIGDNHHVARLLHRLQH